MITKVLAARKVPNWQPDMQPDMQPGMQLDTAQPADQSLGPDSTESTIRGRGVFAEYCHALAFMNCDCVVL